MFKRILASLIIIPILGLLIYGYLNLRNSRESHKDAFMILPEKALLLIEWHGLKQFLKNTENPSDTIFKNYICNQENIKEYQTFINNLYLELDKEQSLQIAFSNNNIYTALYKTNPKNYNWFFCTTIPKEIDNSVLLKIIQKINNNKFSVKNNGSTYELKTGLNSILYFYFTNGIFAASESQLLLNKSLLLVDKGDSKFSNNKIENLMKLSGTNNDFSIYAYADGLNELLPKNLTDNYSLIDKLIKKNTLVSADVKMESDYIFTTGFILTPNNEKLDKPEKFEMSMVIPNNFGSLEWFGNSLNFIKNTDSISNLVNDCFDNEIAYLNTSALNSDINYYKYQIIELKENTFFIKSINKIDSSFFNTVYNDSSFSLPSGKLPNLLNRNYINSHEIHGKQIKNYLVLANNKMAVTKFQEQILIGNTLDKNPDFIKSNDLVFSKSNSVNIINPICDTKYLTENIIMNGQKTFSSNVDWLNKITLIINLTSNNGKEILSNYYIGYNKYNALKLNIAWRKKNENKSYSEFIKLFSKEDSSTFVLCKGENKIDIFDNYGNIYSSISTIDTILGNIISIKSKKSKNEYCIFNTPNKIYMYNVKGKLQNGFPINLESKASNNILVSYNSNNEARITIACNNKKIYQYNIKGKIVDEWKVTTLQNGCNLNLACTNSNEKPIYFGFDNESIFFKIDSKGKHLNKKDSSVLKIINIKKNEAIGNKLGIVLANNTAYIIDIKKGVAKNFMNNSIKIFDFFIANSNDNIAILLTDKGICEYNTYTKKIKLKIIRKLDEGKIKSEIIEGINYIFYYDSINKKTYCFDGSMKIKVGFPISSNLLPILFTKNDESENILLLNSWQNEIDAIYFNEK